MINDFINTKEMPDGFVKSFSMYLNGSKNFAFVQKTVKKDIRISYRFLNFLCDAKMPVKRLAIAFYWYYYTTGKKKLLYNRGKIADALGVSYGCVNAHICELIDGEIFSVKDNYVHFEFKANHKIHNYSLPSYCARTFLTENFCVKPTNSAYIDKPLTINTIKYLLLQLLITKTDFEKFYIKKQFDELSIKMLFPNNTTEYKKAKSRFRKFQYFHGDTFNDFGESLKTKSNIAGVSVSTLQKLLRMGKNAGIILVTGMHKVLNVIKYDGVNYWETLKNKILPIVNYFQRSEIGKIYYKYSHGKFYICQRMANKYELPFLTGNILNKMEYENRNYNIYNDRQCTALASLYYPIYKDVA